MNISPISNIRFGEVIYSHNQNSDKQNTTKPINEGGKDTHKSSLALTFTSIACIGIMVLTGLSKYNANKIQNSNTIEKAMQYSTKVAKDSLQLFK